MNFAEGPAMTKKYARRLGFTSLVLAAMVDGRFGLSHASHSERHIDPAREDRRLSSLHICTLDKRWNRHVISGTNLESWPEDE